MKVVNTIDKNIFRKYDIRGTYNINLNEDISYTIGRAYATYIKQNNKTKCVVGHDNRLSSENLNNALIKGILDSGIDVIDIGLVTTPMLYYARVIKNVPGIMITASHNPKDDNGFKISFNDVENAKGEEIFKFRDFVLNSKFDIGNGILYKDNIEEEYMELFKKTLNFGNKKLKVVLDCANGTTSIIAKKLYSMFPLDLIMLYDKSDGNFPNHHPDPIVKENMEDLRIKVLEEKADIGIGFDGDGDRAGFVNEKGEIFTPDEYAIIIIRDILTKSTNKRILYDIKCSKTIEDEVLELNGLAFENRTGASYMMDRVINDNMAFGIEYSGHIYFNDTFPAITSGLYAGLKLLEIMSKIDKPVSELYKSKHKYYSTDEIKFEFPDNIKEKIIDNIRQYTINKGYKIKEIDGIKVYYEDGWALIRCSNTGPNITTRFEAKSKERLEEIKKEFTNLLNSFKEV